MQIPGVFKMYSRNVVRGASPAGRTEVFNGLLVSAGDSEDLPRVWVWRKYVKILSQGWVSLKSRESRSRVGMVLVKPPDKYI